MKKNSSPQEERPMGASLIHMDQRFATTEEESKQHRKYRKQNMENQTNKWTVEMLKQHMDQRFIDQDKAAAAAIIAADKAVAAALAAAERAVASAMLAAKEAVLKAEIATEKRFEGVNEFRAALADQANTLMTRSEYSIGHNSLADRVSGIEAYRSGFLTRNEHQAVHDSLLEKIEGLTERLNKQDGKSSGGDITIGKIYGAIGAGSAMIAIIVLLVQLLMK